MLNQNKKRTDKYSLYGKIAACLGLFALLFLWGWQTEHKHQRWHNPPAIQSLTENHPEPEVTIVRAYELDHAHIFLPRQYVKILRLEPDPPTESNHWME